MYVMKYGNKEKTDFYGVAFEDRDEADEVMGCIKGLMTIAPTVEPEPKETNCSTCLIKEKLVRLEREREKCFKSLNYAANYKGDKKFMKINITPSFSLSGCVKELIAGIQCLQGNCSVDIEQR